MGARLDSQPELFFILRGVKMEELIAAASESATAPLEGKAKKVKGVLADADLSELFGVELEGSRTPAARKQKRVLRKTKPPNKPKSQQAKKSR